MSQNASKHFLPVVNTTVDRGGPEPGLPSRIKASFLRRSGDSERRQSEPRRATPVSPWLQGEERHPAIRLQAQDIADPIPIFPGHACLIADDLPNAGDVGRVVPFGTGFR